MKRRWWLGLVFLPVIPWLVVRSCDKPELAVNAPAPASVRNGGGLSQVSAPPETDSAESTVNERIRPSQRPEPKVYAKPKPEEYPTAVAVEGKTGFAISPYNGKIIDLREIPSGTLVADPTFQPSEKKYFRAP